MEIFTIFNILNFFHILQDLYIKYMIISLCGGLKVEEDTRGVHNVCRRFHNFKQSWDPYFSSLLNTLYRGAERERERDFEYIFKIDIYSVIYSIIHRLC